MERHGAFRRLCLANGHFAHRTTKQPGIPTLIALKFGQLVDKCCKTTFIRGSIRRKEVPFSARNAELTWSRSRRQAAILWKNRRLNAESGCSLLTDRRGGRPCRSREMIGKLHANNPTADPEAKKTEDPAAKVHASAWMPATARRLYTGLHDNSQEAELGHAQSRQSETYKRF